jgi:hypothetical protein
MSRRSWCSVAVMVVLLGLGCGAAHAASLPQVAANPHAPAAGAAAPTWLGSFANLGWVRGLGAWMGGAGVEKDGGAADPNGTPGKKQALPASPIHSRKPGAVRGLASPR